MGSNFNTLPELLAFSAREFRDVRVMFDPHSKPIREITYGELSPIVARLGAGLIKLGVATKDRIALFSDNQPNWLISDLAICSIGAVDVPRGADTAAPEFGFILEHSGAVAAFVENKKLLDRIAALPVWKSLKFAVLMQAPANGKSFTDEDQSVPIYTIDDLIAMGEGNEALFDKAAKSVSGHDLASIVYTSGTTGSPKGVMLSHRNLMTQPSLVNLGYTPAPGEIQLSILPSWHAYERATEYFGMSHGTTITYSDKRYLRDDLLKLCPQLLPCVPRIWEMVYKAVLNKVTAAPKRQQDIFNFFIRVGSKFVAARRVVYGKVVSKAPLGIFERIEAWSKYALLLPIYKLGDRLVYQKLRNTTGGRLRAAVSGGGSLAPYLDDFLEMIGVEILNGYGLTETSPVICVRTVGNNVRGTVGKALPETLVSIRNTDGEEVSQGDVGEIWVKGPQIMQGYYHNDDATAKVMKGDGWFVTGDLGWLTNDGNLVIAGRSKDTIVLSSGENVEPEPIEDTCRKSVFVQQIVLVGQDKKTLGALVVPDFPALTTALNLPDSTSKEDLTDNPEAVKLVKADLAKVMEGGFKASESISRVKLLTEGFTEANGMLTNTMKIKRNVVLSKFASEIEALFNG